MGRLYGEFTDGTKHDCGGLKVVRDDASVACDKCGAVVDGGTARGLLAVLRYIAGAGRGAAQSMGIDITPATKEQAAEWVEANKDRLV